MKVVLVTGGRTWGLDVCPHGAAPHERTASAMRARAQRLITNQTLDALLLELGPFLLIEGAAPGADDCAMAWAYRTQIPSKRYPALWRKHGRSAGPIRNQQMLEEGKPDLVIAFPGGSGTSDMKHRARIAGVPVREIEETP